MSGSGASKKSKNTFYYVNIAIMFVLMFGIGQLPTFGQVTPLGMQILGIFVAVLYGWCTVNLLWPSLFGIVAVGMTDYCTIKESFAAAFGADIPLMIIVVFVLAAYFEECGLNQYIANWFISRKIGEGRPWVFTMLIFAAAWVMSAFVSTFATIIIMWAIFYKVCDLVGEPRRTKYTGIVVAAIVIICGTTGALFPFKAFSVISIGLTEKAVGALDINFVTWTLFNVVISILLCLGFVLACRIVMRPDLSRIKDAGKNFAYLRNQKMEPKTKIGAAILALFIIGLMLPSILPKTVPGMAILNEMSILGVGTLCIVLLASVKTKEGKSYINVTHLISKGVDWQLIILIGSTMPLCNALEAEEVGVLQTVIAWMTQTFAGLSPMMFLIAFTALFLITTQVTHNLVLLLVFTPVLTKMGMGFGVNPVLVALMIYFTAMTAYATPAASSNAAMIFGNAEWVATKDAYMCGFLALVTAFIILIGVGVPLGSFLF